tara:strand:+ start:525 stop:1100 length:576 start_codon:yes stop_codon:yes gene_type:complete
VQDKTGQIGLSALYLTYHLRRSVTYENYIRLERKNMNLYPGPEPFTYQIPIRFTHTDPAGYVFFPRYFEMMQAVSEEWFENCLGVNFADMIMMQSVGEPTAHTECQFIKPCVLGDKLDIAIILDKFGTSSLHLRFIGTVKGDIRMRARAAKVLLDMKAGKPVPFGQDMRLHLQAYQDNVIPPDNIQPQRRE